MLFGGKKTFDGELKMHHAYVIESTNNKRASFTAEQRSPAGVYWRSHQFFGAKRLSGSTRLRLRNRPQFVAPHTQNQ